MQDLLDLLNELSEKYKFEEGDIKKIQDCVFAIEVGDDSVKAEGDDFVSPEVEETEEVEVENDG